jgi:hypothetical protein
LGPTDTSGPMTDLTPNEQSNVRAALRFLKTRCGSYKALSKALGFGKSTAAALAAGRVVGPLVAFRVARLAKVSVDDVLAGRFPESGVCAHCGAKMEREAAE